MWARKLLDDHWLLAVCASTLLLASPAVAENADYSQRLAALINLYRVDHGRAVLSVDAELTRLALGHSVAMAKNRQMSHDGFESRARQSESRLCVENVGWNHRSPDAQLDGWRASPGHDQNLLDARVERIGIGESAGYVTMLACGR